MKRIHHLKTLPEFFQQVWLGIKRFEVRKNDRDYNEGDVLILEEWSPETQYTGRFIDTDILYLLHGGQFGIEKGHSVLGLSRITRGTK